MDKIRPSEEKMIAALTRSGYILEGEVAKIIENYGFFVESSPVIIDEITSKSREFDIRATHVHNFWIDSKSAISNVMLAVEVKNNAAPIVLMNSGLKSSFFYDFHYLKQHNEFIEDDADFEFDMEFLMRQPNKVMSQYSSFVEKKASLTKEQLRENPDLEKYLIADHIEGYHESLMKIVQHCEEQLEGIANRDKSEAPNVASLLCMPILVIQDDLYQLDTGLGGEYKLERIEEGILSRKYHFKGKPKTALIHVMTKKGLPEFLALMKKYNNGMKERHATNYAKIQVSKEEFKTFFGDVP